MNFKRFKHGLLRGPTGHLIKYINTPVCLHQQVDTDKRAEPTIQEAAL